MALFGSRDQFCTECGKKLERKEIICANCRKVIDEAKTRKRDEKALKELRKFTDSKLNVKYTRLLLKHGLGTKEDQQVIRDSVIEDIKNMHLAPEEVKPRLLHHVEIRKEQRTKFCPVCGTKAKRATMIACDSCGANLVEASSKEEALAKGNNDSVRNIKSKISLVTGESLADSDYFKARKKKFNVTYNYNYFKSILKAEAKAGHLKYDDVESRLDELLEINDPKTMYELGLKKKMPTHLIKTKDDFVKYVGYGSKKAPIPIDDAEWEKINEKLDNSDGASSLQDILSHESYNKSVEIIKETKKVPISIPYDKNNLGSNPLIGALTGDIIAGGAGRMIGGLAGAGDILGSTMGAMSGGLILGGAGALIGGLMAAADDAIKWHNTVLVLNDSELIIGGKFALPYKDIKHIDVGDFKNDKIITITLQAGGLQFKTPNAESLKEVMDEMIENDVSKEEPDLLEEAVTSTNENNKVDTLMKYAELYEKGLLTKEEFEAKKNELL